MRSNHNFMMRSGIRISKIRSVAVLRMRNGTSQPPFRLALGNNHDAPAPLRVTEPSRRVPCGDGLGHDLRRMARRRVRCALHRPWLRDLGPLRPSGGKLALMPSGDYRPWLFSPWPTAINESPFREIQGCYSLKTCQLYLDNNSLNSEQRLMSRTAKWILNNQSRATT